MVRSNNYSTSMATWLLLLGCFGFLAESFADMENWKKMDDVGDKHCMPVVKHGPVLSRKACFDICGNLAYCMYERVSGRYCLASNTCDEWETIPSHNVDRYDIWKRLVLVDGGYSNWHPWGPCNKNCGTGSMSRNRHCNNPTPSHGGLNCSRYGSDTETSPCNTHKCKVNGGYSNWHPWGPCNKNCGTGSMSRSRHCNNPTPSHGGLNCSRYGSDTETSPCNTHKCKVDGGYSNWHPWGPCNKPCGTGSMSRNRHCHNPTPSHGGLSCSRYGSDTETSPCNTHKCKGPCASKPDGKYAKRDIHKYLECENEVGKNVTCRHGIYDPCSKKCVHLHQVNKAKLCRCRPDSNYNDPWDCHKFVTCSNNNVYFRDCAISSLVYDPSSDQCVHESKVECQREKVSGGSLANIVHYHLYKATYDGKGFGVNSGGFDAAEYQVTGKVTLKACLSNCYKKRKQDRAFNGAQYDIHTSSCYCEKNYVKMAKEQTEWLHYRLH